MWGIWHNAGGRLGFEVEWVTAMERTDNIIWR